MRKTFKKKLVTIAMIAALGCMTLSACGSSSNSGEKDSSSNSSNTGSDNGSKDDNSGSTGNTNNSTGNESNPTGGNSEEKDPARLDAITVDGNVLKFSVNGLEGYEKLSGLAYQSKGCFEKAGLDHGEFIEKEYIKADGFSATDEVIPEKEVNSVVGYVSLANVTLPQTMYGSAGLFPVYTVDAGDYKIKVPRFSQGIIPLYKGDLDAYAYDYMFINNFNALGITPDSSKKDIEAAGFHGAGIKNSYLRIISDVEPSWDDYSATYDKMYSDELTHYKVNKGELNNYVDYGEILRSIELSFLKSSVSAGDKNKDLGICEKADKAFEALSVYNGAYKDLYNKSRKELIVNDMALAHQLYLMEQGKIDYFTIVEIECCDEEADKMMASNLQVNGFSYKQNVAHVYIFSKEKYFEKYFK